MRIACSDRNSIPQQDTPCELFWWRLVLVYRASFGNGRPGTDSHGLTARRERRRRRKTEAAGLCPGHRTRENAIPRHRPGRSGDAARLLRRSAQRE